MTLNRLKNYSELKELTTFRERYNYLRLGGLVGETTFGLDRILNQVFYKSPEWMKVRREVILRDNACDLGIPGYDIETRILIHHMNPITEQDILNRSEILLDPEYLICVTHSTHNAIHYGDEFLVVAEPIIRTPNDTCPWRTA